jgi:hypothetical protein
MNGLPTMVDKNIPIGKNYVSVRLKQLKSYRSVRINLVEGFLADYLPDREERR